MTDNSNKRKIAVGLDIGTTTISTVVLDCEAETVLHTCTVSNDSGIQSDNSWEHIQIPDMIWQKTKALLDNILEEYPVSSIGVTGQMHGILYTSPNGTPLSPLYTWQDGRAGQGENSACDIIKRETGYTVPEGYGFATHYHLLRNGEAPKESYFCSTIMDYVTMRLCGLSKPITHITDAASWGFYRNDTQGFDEDALSKLGVDSGVLPDVTADTCIIGTYKGIPVSVAIGDNQAAFIGSVKEAEHTVLVNIGTGSQICMLADKPLADGSPLVESRPFDGKKYLLSGSCLCGGRAYALLESFFRGYAVAAGLPDSPQYEILNKLAEKGLKDGSCLQVKTTFCGTRADPTLRGQINGIGENNLTPEAMAAGVLCGMADELFDMYKTMPSDTARYLVASGNAVRKNVVLQQILTQKFNLPIQIPKNTEEAASGAALFGNKAMQNRAR